MVRQLSIDQFESEGRRVSYGTPENAPATTEANQQKLQLKAGLIHKLQCITIGSGLQKWHNLQHDM